MKTIYKTLYDIEELKGLYPDGYRAAIERQRDRNAQSDYLPWADETVASMKQVIQDCGGRLDDYNVGPFSRSYLNVSVCEPDPEEEDIILDDRESRRTWLLNQVGVKSVEDYNPTGYFMDRGLFEAVLEVFENGNNLKTALESLAYDVTKALENEYEQFTSEEEVRAQLELKGEVFDENGAEYD